MRPESGCRIASNWPDCFRLLQNDNDVTIFRHDVIATFFWRCFVSLVKFSNWAKFHVNIITGSGVMTIFFNKWLIRNPEIENTLVWVLHNIWRLGRVRDTKFGRNISLVRNVTECCKMPSWPFLSYSEETNKWEEGGGVKITPPHPY